MQRWKNSYYFKELGPKYDSYSLQRYYTENSKQIFPEMKLRGLIPNSYIYVSVRIYKSFKDK